MTVETAVLTLRVRQRPPEAGPAADGTRRRRRLLRHVPALPAAADEGVSRVNV